MLTLLEEITDSERRAVFASVTTLFALMAGHLLVETARDAIFLANLPAEQLPLLYIAIAVLSLLATQLQRALGEFINGRYMLVAWLVIGGLLNLLLWIFLPMMGSAGIYVLYVVPGVVLTVALIQYWVQLGGSLTVGDAKRLYVFIGAGGALGAIAGSGLAAAVASVTEPRHLLLIAAVVFILAPAAAIWMLRELPEEPDKQRSDRELAGWEALKSQLQEPYIARVAALSLLIPMAATVADYLFKSVAADRLDAAVLGSFIGLVYLGLNVASLAIQLGAVRKTVRKLSVAGALAVLPLIMSLGGVAVLVGFAFFGAVGLKVADGALRHSLHDTAEELLYVPLSKSERSGLKALAAVVGKRGGQALASVGLLGLVALGVDTSVFGGFLIILAGVAGLVAINLRRHYVELFRQRLRDERLEHLFDYPELDIDSLERLVGYLSSDDDAQVIAAIDLLQSEGRTRSIPALILYHPSRDVVLRALSAYVDEQHTDVLPALERIERDADPELHAALLSAHAALDPDEGWLARHLDSDDAVVRSVATFHLVARGWRDRSEVDIDISEVLEEGSPARKRAMVFALGVARASDFIHELVMMLDDESIGVRREAVQAMKVIGEESCKEALRWRLSDRQIRDDLIDAFKSLGDDGFQYLVDSLDDETLPRRVRWQLPRAIGKFGRTDSGAPMARRLPLEDDGKVRARLVDEMERLQLVDGAISLPEEPLRESIDWHIGRAYRLMHWRLELQRHIEDEHGPALELLLQMLSDKMEHATDLVLRINGLMSNTEDFRRARRGLNYGDAVERASAVELLEANLESRYQNAVVGLVEERDESARLKSGRNFYQPHSLDSTEIWDELLESRSETLAMLVASLATEIEATEAVGSLRDAANWAGDEAKHSLVSAISQLEREQSRISRGASHAG